MHSSLQYFSFFIAALYLLLKIVIFVGLSLTTVDVFTVALVLHPANDVSRFFPVGLGRILPAHVTKVTAKTGYSNLILPLVSKSGIRQVNIGGTLGQCTTTTTP